MRRFIYYLYLLPVIGLFFYSFTQVDLSLTLSRVSLFQTVEKSFQHIGYFQRPLSTEIYIVLLLFLFGFYIFFLREAYLKRIKARTVWILVIVTAIFLAFSYNAFSYDIFNYIFDAKIITHYHQNPYFHRALDFPGDPMLSFMQWTHRTYPYGPVWLGLTVPLSFIGMNLFIPTFFLFKALSLAFFLGCAYLIWKINIKILPENKLFNLVLFALNPLVLAEMLVSGHHESSMMFFALLGLFLYFSHRRILAIISIIISSQIKIPTIALIAPIALSFLPFKQAKLDTQKFIWACIGVSLLTLVYVLTRLEIQPWYFLWIFPLICLLKPNRYTVTLSIGFCLGLLLRYSVYFYFGNWDGVALPLRNGLTVAATIIPVTSLWIYDKLGKKLL